MSAPATITRFPGVTLFLPDGVMAGDLTYDARTQQLAIAYADGETEALSIDLTLDGYLAAPGEALIKDWSEHAGLTSALVDAGIVMRVETLTVGPFSSRAYRVLVLTPGGDRPMSTSTPLVHIATLTGQDCDDAVQAAEAEGGSVDAAARHLAQWDYGTETDAAALLWPHDMPTRADLECQPHQLHTAHVGGLEYLVQIDHGLRMYALYRPTLTQVAAA